MCSEQKIIELTDDTTDNIGILLDSLLENLVSEFHENPSIAYTIVLDSMSATVGHLINMFPTTSADKILNHVVEIIVRAHQASSDVQNSQLCRTMGNA